MDARTDDLLDKTHFLLEEVFVRNGVPTITFVQPVEYTRLLISLRSPGRNIIVEGPSGIGKTTAIHQALKDLNVSEKTVLLSARKKQDLEYIEILPEMNDPGIIVIDDFHLLSDDLKRAIADKMKSFADEQIQTSKFIIIGINEAGRRLIELAGDLVNRIDRYTFERNPDEKILQLIEKGEKALKIEIPCKKEIIDECLGGFFIAQMLCYELCVASDVTETRARQEVIQKSFEGVKNIFWRRLDDRFRERCVAFCRGNRFRRDGRAPYLNLLKLLSESATWGINLNETAVINQNMKNSINQIVQNSYIQQIFVDNPILNEVLYYDENSTWLIIEDPQFLFYVRNIPWRSFAQSIGFIASDIDRRYDFALSFAGVDRDIAEAIFNELTARQMEVFYDYNEQYRILSADVEEYLGPIYQSEAYYVVAIISSSYPKRIWTQFESKLFHDRFKDGDVIVVIVDNFQITNLTSTFNYGHCSFDRSGTIESQITEICDMLEKKMREKRLSERRSH